MSKILFTGACGNAGSRVCSMFIEQGMDIRATDIFIRDNISFPVTVADLRNVDECREVVDGVDTVIHFAAHHSEHGRDPRVVYLENVALTINVAQACVDTGAKRLVFASSIQAITASRPRPHEGQPVSPCSLPYLPADGDIPGNAFNYYGHSKIACENVLRFFSRKFSLTCIALRFPWLMDSHRVQRVIQDYEERVKRYLCLDECMTYLTFDEIARLLKAILSSSIEGFRLYMPCEARPLMRRPIKEIIDMYYKGIPLRKPAQEMTSLVDLSRIAEETGWQPHDEA